MQTLRTSLMLTRLVLTWFVLTFGMAVASPLIAPTTVVVICSHEGAQTILVDADGKAVTSASHTLHCPLCLPATAPPPEVSISVPAPSAVSVVQSCCINAYIPIPVGAPLPARGPPQSA